MSNNKISKNNAAKYTADLLHTNHNVIFGSGSTVNLVIDYLSKSHSALSKLNAVSASSYTTEKLLEHHINEISLEEMKNKKLETSLICIDGADQVSFDEHGIPICILKGHGSALVREKILWEESDIIYVVIDKNKLVNKITGYIPVEIVPLAYNLVIDKIKTLYSDIEIRLHMDSNKEPLLTDNKNFIAEIHHEGFIDDVNNFHKHLKQFIGVVDTGIFDKTLIEKCKFIIGYDDEVKMT